MNGIAGYRKLRLMSSLFYAAGSTFMRGGATTALGTHPKGLLKGIWW